MIEGGLHKGKDGIHIQLKTSAKNWWKLDLNQILHEQVSNLLDMGSQSTTQKAKDITSNLIYIVPPNAWCRE